MALLLNVDKMEKILRAILQTPGRREYRATDASASCHAAAAPARQQIQVFSTNALSFYICRHTPNQCRYASDGVLNGEERR